MRRFLKKIIIATVCFSSLIIGVYFLLHLMVQKPITNSNNCVFVWGDSQMYYGIDVLSLEDRLDMQVLTSAYAGSGIYDFLVSEKNIPNNHVCIVSFPECALLRKPSSDYNRTGYELSCLKMLFFQIVLIQFPFHKQVESFARNSIDRHLTDSLKRELIDNYAMKYDTIVLQSDSLLMHDLSHLNEVGARLLTAEIADILCADTVNNCFIEVQIQSR